jgi:hypothetical protein
MAQNIVNNLFGIDPEALQQQRAAPDFANAFKFAQLDPLQRANLAIYQGSAGLGRAATQLLGGDEQLNKATKVRELSSQFDMTSADGLRQFAQAVAPFAPDVAQQAVKRSDEMRLTAANIFQKSGENINTLISSGKFTPESLAAYRQSRDPADLVLVEKGKTIGLSVDGQQVYQSGDSQYILGPGGQRVPYYGRLESKTPKTELKVDLGGVFDKAFAKQEADKQAEDWVKAGQSYADASALARNVREMENIVGNAFVGSYGSLQAGVSRVFGGGKRLNDTEVFDALSAQLVLPLAKLLPGSLAVKELDQLIKTKPNLKQQEGTIRRLLNTINQDLRASEISYEAGEKYRAANNGKISGFNPYIAKNRATRFIELEAKYKSGKTLTEPEKVEARKIAQELQIQGL